MASTITADNGVVSGSAGIKSSADSSGVLALASGTGTTAVTIDTSQNVGIGTSSPVKHLQIGNNSTTSEMIRFATTAANFDVGMTASGCEITTGNNQPIIFTNNATERMRIDSSGNLLVGTSNASATFGAGVKLLPAGPIYTVMAASTNGDSTMQVFSTGAGAYRFYVGLGGTVYATSTTISAISDQRFKENVRDLDAGLAEIMALKPRLYDWKEGKGADIKNARGFIAQEFEQIFPDLIDEWKDEAPEGEEPYKSVRQDLIPVLVKAIQEQQALINNLTERLAALEGAK